MDLVKLTADRDTMHTASNRCERSQIPFSRSYPARPRGDRDAAS